MGLPLLFIKQFFLLRSRATNKVVRLNMGADAGAIGVDKK
ncbi:MAG: hypothetical protein ACJAWN_001474 [Neolewinella sp.]|jgi:hypothetical protein